MDVWQRAAAGLTCAHKAGEQTVDRNTLRRMRVPKGTTTPSSITLREALKREQALISDLPSLGT